jgi:predicted Zn-dependent protease
MAGHSPQQMAELALRAARLDDCIVIAEQTSSAHLRWAANSLTTNGVARSRRLTVIAVRRGPDGVSAGVVSRAGVRLADVADVVAQAEHSAAATPPAPDAAPLIAPVATPAVPAGQSGQGAPGPAGWDDQPARSGIGALRGLADDLGGAIAAAKAGRRLLYGYAEHSMTSTFLASSAGLRLRHDQPAGQLELNAKSADLTRSAWAGLPASDFAGVSVTGLERQLARRLSWGTRKVELPPGRYEVILSPSAMADLYASLYWAAGGQDASEGRSAFSSPGGRTRIGEQLTALPLTLRSDPAAPGLECEPFVIAHASWPGASVFDNGLRLAPTEWISGGRLTALRQTRQSARQSGLPVTPMIGNLILDRPGEVPTLAQMIATTGRGLLLTCLWYVVEVDQQSLLLTGLTRDGTYLIENGEVTAEVSNFRFNESPLAMLGRLTEVGRTEPALPRELADVFPRTAMPPARVEAFNMSAVSQAI